MIKYNKSKWNFENGVSKSFDSHVRQNVPCYDDLHFNINEISSFFIQPKTNIYDIGCATGYFIENNCDDYQNSNFIGIDNSPSMILELKKKFNDNKNVNIIQNDVQNVNIQNSSLVLCFLTLHFIPYLDRLSILKNIYKGMNQEGAFILVEKTYSSDGKINHIFDNILHEFKLKQGMQKEEVLEKTRSIRGILNPLTDIQNIKLLKDAGFCTVELFFKYNNFAGFLAIKK